MKFPTGDPKSSSEEIQQRLQAIHLARRSQDVVFVPTLIDLLEDRSWNGIVTTQGAPTRIETRHTFSETAREALRDLTFEDFGPEAAPWRAWWATQRNNTWKQLLNGFVNRVLPRAPAAEPWVMNEWMDRLKDADDPAVLPFLSAYFRRPRLLVDMSGPNTMRGGGGGLRPSLVLLLNLASQGAKEARELLYECGESIEYPLAIECPKMVAVFDRDRAVKQLRSHTDRSYRYWVGQALLELGDPSGISLLIEELEPAELHTPSLALSLLRAYTQHSIPYNPDASVADRRQAADQWRQWWGSVEQGFVLKPLAARIDLTWPRR